MSEAFAFTTSPINMPKVDKRSRLEGFNQSTLPKGTKIRINKSSAAKIDKLLEGWTIVSLAVVGHGGTIKCWLNTKGKPELLNKNDQEEVAAIAIYSVLKEDDSLESLLKTGYSYASPMEILQVLLDNKVISIEELTSAASYVHQENVKKEE